jgi:hypothetical protein
VAGNPEGKKPLVKLQSINQSISQLIHRWENNNEIDLQGGGEITFMRRNLLHRVSILLLSVRCN